MLCYSICDDHTYIHTSSRDIASIHPLVRDTKHMEYEDPKHRVVRDSRHGEASRNRERPCEVPVGDSFQVQLSYCSALEAANSGL